MPIHPTQLKSHLQQGLKPAYIVSGEEPLQVQEACQLIRNAAKAEKYDEREMFIVENNFNWNELLSASNSISLFSAKKLIDLSLASGTIGVEGSKALLSYVTTPPEGNLLLIRSGKLSKSTKNNKWFKALIDIGTHIEVWPIQTHQLPKWIAQRMRQANLFPDEAAVKLLAELVDGNLLAASQEIEKLKLLMPEQNSRVSAQTIHDCVANSSRYNIFTLVDNALKGDSRQCLKILAGLRNEGIEPLHLLWHISREVRQLCAIVNAIENGLSSDKAMQSKGIWRKRQALISNAVSRLSSIKLNQLMLQIASADQLVKGVIKGNPWDKLEKITLNLAGISLSTE